MYVHTYTLTYVDVGVVGNIYGSSSLLMYIFIYLWYSFIVSIEYVCTYYSLYIILTASKKCFPGRLWNSKGHLKKNYMGYSYIQRRFLYIYIGASFPCGAGAFFMRAYTPTVYFVSSVLCMQVQLPILGMPHCCLNRINSGSFYYYSFWGEGLTTRLSNYY